ncbi:MAG: 16S rRNA (cytidine(1402)-2'-O)-methyltransferase [Gemmatimonadetes bacterium]|nr:16S rRNA (cytidine(1402)-2'-O)-methyltransferase [Gemmatimonadota bacterium]
MTSGTLYVVATPLGNLGDISERARATLSTVAVVAAEDTRRTRILLAHIGARPRLVSFHAHSPRSRMELLLSALAEGQSVALVSDAGTPTISDPGANLVMEARSNGVPVVAVPGPSAVAAALSISGLAADRYIFLGFPPRRGKERQHLLRAAAESPWTVVMFESAQRVGQLLDDLREICGGDRQVAVARELTKVHEEVKTGSLEDVGTDYREHPPRGEITVVLSGAPVASPSRDLVSRTDEVTERARSLLAEGATKRDVAQILARELHLSRNEVYRLVTAL